MRTFLIPILLLQAFMVGCAARASKPVVTAGTLAELREAPVDVQEVKIEQGLDQAMQYYRGFLEETPETSMTPEAMRRLADLQLEKQFGIHSGDGKPREMAAPQPGKTIADLKAGTGKPDESAPAAGTTESDQEFERRTTAATGLMGSNDSDSAAAGMLGSGEAPSGPLEAITIYNKLLNEYPGYRDSDQVLYQMARAYDELGRTEEAMETMERLIRTNPNSEHYDEVEFRRGEYFFTRRKYRDAENAYSAIINLGTRSSYYELALYKLGWTFYKQELYEEALHRYIAVLDHKVSTGYDFDQTHEEEDERRVADTFQVISYSLNNLAGPEAVGEYFSTFGNRSYEDRVYGNLGQHLCVGVFGFRVFAELKRAMRNDYPGGTPNARLCVGIPLDYALSGINCGAIILQFVQIIRRRSQNGRGLSMIREGFGKFQRACDGFLFDRDALRILCDL